MISSIEANDLSQPDMVRAPQYLNAGGPAIRCDLTRSVFSAPVAFELNTFALYPASTDNAVSIRFCLIETEKGASASQTKAPLDSVVPWTRIRLSAISPMFQGLELFVIRPGDGK